MDDNYRVHGQSFEWDHDKALANLRNHNVSFEKACEVFFDPFVAFVGASDGTEARDAAIGLSENWDCLFVVHVIRREDTIRIISARLATSAERRDYEHD